jgi:hypothetical protein
MAVYLSDIMSVYFTGRMFREFLFSGTGPCDIAQTVPEHDPWTSGTLKIKATRSFETSETSYSATQSLVRKDLNSRLHLRENFNARTKMNFSKKKIKSAGFIVLEVINC